MTNIPHMDKIVSSAWIEHVPFAKWLVYKMKPKTIVDLGTHTGCSALAFAAPGIGVVHTVDKFDDKDIYEEAKENVAVLKNIVMYKCSFDYLAERWDHGPIDILHIDGNHEFKDVQNDCTKWIPKLSDRGIVLMHDAFNPRFPDVLKIFVEGVGGHKILFPAGFGLGVSAGLYDIIRAIYNTWPTKIVLEPVIKDLLRYSLEFHKVLMKMEEKLLSK